MTLPEGGVLGQTKVAKELILGNPIQLDNNATRLRDEATRVQGLIEDLDAIGTPGWNDGLGAPAYDVARKAEKDKWTAMHAVLTQGAASLTTYAAAVRTAQASAQQAIDMWELGEQQTRDARAAHDANVQKWNDLFGTRQVQVPQYGGGVPQVPIQLPGLLGGYPTFVDPGEATRQEAETILADARTTLDKAGQTALTELGAPTEENREDKDKGEEAPWFGAEGDAEGPSFSWDLWEDTFGKNPADGPDGKYDDDHGDSPFKISLGSAKGSAWIFNTDGEWSENFGGVDVKATGEFYVGKAEGSAEATVDANGLRLNAEGRLVVIGADGEVSGEWGVAEAKLSGGASAEANADGHLTIDQTRAHAGGELFAGAKAEASLEGDVAGVGGKGEVEGWAGAGIAGDVDVGLKDGKLTIGGSGGIAWGLGGKVGGEVTLDFPEIYDNGAKLVEGIGGLFD